MEVSLTPELEQLIQEKINSSHYILSLVSRSQAPAWECSPIGSANGKL